MDSLEQDCAAGILDLRDTPCISLYQPTHRHHPHNRQDPIRFGNLVKSAGQSMGRKYPAKEIEALLDPFRALASDRAFWNHTLDGLAVMAAPGLFRVYRLQRTVPEMVIVADSFHVKPLHRILQSADRYQVLGLNRQEIRLYEGNRDALDGLEPAPGVPRTVTDALGEELSDPHLTVASYGGAGGPGMRHGHGGRKDESDKDTGRFFRAVDRAILEHHSRPTGLPLILAALPEYHGIFRGVSHNPFLLDEAVDIHPDALSIDALRARVWAVVEPAYLARLAALVEEHGAARARGLGADDLAQIARAALSGRVATLLIEAGREIPGRIDPESGALEPADLAHPEVDDLLDDLGALVLQRGGRIVIVPAERMPSPTGAAAVYRF